MYLIYDTEDGWKLVPAPNDTDYPVGRVADDPFPHELFSDIDSKLLPTEDGCQIWTGGAHRRNRTNAAPYFLNRYIPEPYKYQISARQLILARHLNVNILGMPHFRIGMTCTRSLCVAVDHMIPFNFFPRTQTGSLVHTIADVAMPTKVLTKEEKEAVRRAVLGDLEETKSRPAPVIYDHNKIMSILPKSGRTADDFTPEELAEIERKNNQRKIEEPVTLEEIGFGTKDPIK